MCFWNKHTSLFSLNSQCRERKKIMKGPPFSMVLAILSNVRLGRKCVLSTNALAYSRRRVNDEKEKKLCEGHLLV
jgi:hypothetical protein